MDLDFENAEEEENFVRTALRTFDPPDRAAVIAFCKSLYRAKYRDTPRPHEPPPPFSHVKPT